MINLFNATIQELSLHRIGNKSRNEKMFLSKEPYSNLNNEELIPLLKEFFFKPFRQKEEQYFSFSHEVDLQYNPMVVLSQSIFNNPDNFHETSKLITKHLFEQSNHPHIKPGEVYVAYIRDVEIDGKHVDAIGIFKSETKTDFFNIVNTALPNKDSSYKLDIVLNSGFSFDKIDKGCLILNINKEEGYKIMSIDNNRYDNRYWLVHFLGVEVNQDSNYYTKNYLKFLNDFGKNVVRVAEDCKEQIAFETNALNYFKKNVQFEEKEFVEQVFASIPKGDELVAEFENFRKTNAGNYNIQDVDNFQISPTSVAKNKKVFKNLINLDTNIQIKINVNNPESVERFIEKGFDEEKQMYYYLVYFNKEEK